MELRSTAAAALLLVAFALSAAAEEGRSSGRGPGPANLPAVIGVDVDGRRWTSEELYGRPVLLHFWATWCAPCIGELPILDAADSRYPDLVVLGASVNENDRRSLVAWLNRRGPRHPVIHVSGGLGTGIARDLGVPRIPWAMLFDVRGRRLTQGPPMSLVDEEGRLRLVSERPPSDAPPAPDD